MKLELPNVPAVERTPLVESLLALIRVQQDRIQQLETTVQQLRDEIALLKGQKPRLEIRPSLLETGTPKSAGPEGGKRPGSAKRPKTAELLIHHEVPLHPEGLPVGATFRGYEAYVVQELLMHSDNTRYLRARYDLPGGGSVLAPFPAGVLPVEGGHFGANLIAYILDQYHQAQVTEPLLLTQLWEYGIDISAGQLHRILTENNLLHANCGQRLRYDKCCPRHGKLDAATIVKGYEYAPGQFLVLDEAELERLRPARDRALALDNFIDLGEIDPLLYAGRSLYLAPDGMAAANRLPSNSIHAY